MGTRSYSGHDDNSGHARLWGSRVATIGTIGVGRSYGRTSPLSCGGERALRASYDVKVPSFLFNFKPIEKTRLSS